MTEEEEKAIKNCKLLLNGDISLHILDDDGGTAYAGEVNKLYNDDLDTVIQALEQRIKNQKIYAEEYEKVTKQLNCEVKDNLEKSIALEQKGKEIQELKAKYDKDTHTLQNQLDIANADRVKKDKIIDLMARFIDTELSSEHLSKVLKIEVKPLETYREDIKQYFKKKVRNKYEKNKNIINRNYDYRRNVITNRLYTSR